LRDLVGEDAGGGEGFDCGFVHAEPLGEDLVVVSSTLRPASG
jgi:hypothetical protein